LLSTFSLSVTVIASGLLDRSLWYPTILGVLVVVAAALLFVGSIYLLLGTNMGARLAFLVTFSALTGFMVVLSGLWITTASPLNTLRGSVPAWEIKEVVPTLDEAKTEVVRSAKQDGIKVDAIEAANVKAAVDEGLVTKVDDAIEKFTPEDNEFAIFADVTQFLVVNTWEIGGSRPSWLDGEFRHTPKYAVVQFCGDNPDTVFGLPVPAPECAPEGTEAAKNNGFVILEFNLGDVRFPPVVAFFSSIILFVLSLILFGWYEKDRRAEVAAAESAPATTPARTREPANA
jgi:hypothetical protein